MPLLQPLTLSSGKDLFGLVLLCIGLACTRGDQQPSEGTGAPQFVEVTEEAGIRFVHTNGASGRKYFLETFGSGAAFLDYDNDGDVDLYVVNSADLPGAHSAIPPTNALYRNNGDGTFSEVTGEAGVGDTGYGMGCTAGDYDNDGDLDLYVTNYGPNVLYRNNGDGTFADVTREADVGGMNSTGSARPGQMDQVEWSTSCAFVDYDKDGDLDLYVANNLAFIPEDVEPEAEGPVKLLYSPKSYPGQSGVLYRNEGNGRFVDVTERAGLSNTAGRQLGIVFGDYDDDGDPDLFVANDMVPNFLYRNNGDGTFTEVALRSGVAYNEDGKGEAGMGTDFGDYDNDGDLDLFAASFQWESDTLYRNDGRGLFSDVTFAAGLGKETLGVLTFGAGFLDYDNDGDLDLYIANGHVDGNIDLFDRLVTYAQADQIFRNNGDGTFTDVSGTSGPAFSSKSVGRGTAFGDYDNDGDLDVFVVCNGQPALLLRNDGGNRKHWVGLRLIGRRSNRDGIGARVRVFSGDLVQTDEVRSGSSYLSQNDLRLFFGIGDRRHVDRIEIRWPSGMVQTLRDLKVDQILTVEETGDASEFVQ